MQWKVNTLITSILFNRTDAAILQEPSILDLCPGIKYPITCRQTGISGSDVTPPVFAVRNGPDGPIEVIQNDTAGYDIAAGKLNHIYITETYIYHKLFYLILEEVTSADNNKQFVCVDENEESLKTAFEEWPTTTVVVSSSESKFSVYKNSIGPGPMTQHNYCYHAVHPVLVTDLLTSHTAT